MTNIENRSSITVYLGLGSNLGDPVKQLDLAITALQALPMLEVTAVSGFYRNPAMASMEQADYVNAVVGLQTDTPAETLLDQLQTIEQQQGRKRSTVRWQARTLDIDILLYGDQQIKTDRLVIPHCGLEQRPFVLFPLLELCPDLIIPGLGALVVLCKQSDSSELQKVTVDGRSN